MKDKKQFKMKDKKNRIFFLKFEIFMFMNSKITLG